MDRMVSSAIIAVLLATVAFGSTRLGLGDILGVTWGALALSTFYAGRGVSASLGGVLYTRFPRLTRLLPPLSLLVISASVYMQGVTRNPLLISILTGVQGFAAGFVWPLVQTGVAIHGGTAFMLSVYFATGSIGISFGRALYPYLAEHLGIEGVFSLASLFYLSASLVLALGFNVKLPRRRRPGSARLARGAVLRAAVVNAASGFAVGLDAQILYPLLVEKGLDRFTASYMLSLGSLGGIPAKLSAGRMGDRIGLYDSMLLIGSLIALSLAALSVTGGLIAGVAALAYTSLSAGLVPLARMAAAVEGAKLGAPAALVGFANTLSNAGSILGSLAAPLLASIPGGLVVYAFPLLLASTCNVAMGRLVAAEARS